MKPAKECGKFLVPGLIAYGAIYYGLIFFKVGSALEVTEFIFSSLLLALTLFFVCQLMSNKILQPPE